MVDGPSGAVVPLPWPARTPASAPGPGRVAWAACGRWPRARRC